MPKEIEARFLEINKDDLISKLRKLGAVDEGEKFLEEIIFYDPEFKWRDVERKFVRLRKLGDVTKLTYKQNKEETIDSTTEIELEVSDMHKTEELLEAIGLVAYRHQEKKRHSFHLGKAIFDIDSWPKIPTFLEIEGPDEQTIRDAAQKLGLEWSKAVFDDARSVIEKRYSIPVGTMRWFTFDKFE